MNIIHATISFFFISFTKKIIIFLIKMKKEYAIKVAFNLKLEITGKSLSC